LSTMQRVNGACSQSMSTSMRKARAVSSMPPLGSSTTWAAPVTVAARIRSLVNKTRSSSAQRTGADPRRGNFVILRARLQHCHCRRRASRSGIHGTGLRQVSRPHPRPPLAGTAPAYAPSAPAPHIAARAPRRCRGSGRTQASAGPARRGIIFSRFAERAVDQRIGRDRTLLAGVGLSS
jgi:hypothetical protein